MPPHPELPPRPWMLIHPRCTYLIRTFPQLVMDDTNPEDMDTTGPDHACVSGETRVATRRGQVRVTDLTLGDEILTREGFKRLVCAGETASDAPVYDVWFSNGSVVRATADHPFRVDGRWISADRLRYGNIAVCLSGYQASITPTTTAPLDSDGVSTLDPSLPSITSTTRTKIRPTTRWRTLSACQDATTSAFTAVSSHLALRLKRLYVLLLNGIDQIKAESGIGATHDGYGNYANLRVCSAASATASSSTSAITRSSAPITVSRQRVGEVGWMMYNGPAGSASRRFPLVSTRTRVTAPDSAPSVIAVLPAGRETVYNLTVHECHEFYANGILVKNCDALRYMIAGRPSPTRDVVAQDFPKDSVGWMRTQVMGRPSVPLLGARNVRRPARY
jgi:hypothetical protein